MISGPKLVTAAGIKDGEKGCLAEADWRDAVYDIYRWCRRIPCGASTTR
jgi:hypothetical protein